ncbi:Uncharacterised protein [Klebsiella pneumoniae]|nr:Uncharacterised protein [Klebsiella pneumoniae]SWX03247.1 Uncharacterised protein [Klebsiella pneumoniae]SXP66956.1 Uncharacterised protein [Klebsiella pneumoniae]VDA73138.1 hypothetical protein BANRA_02880 [Klebsiella pneumoniae]
MLPTPGMSAVPHAKKKPVHAYELFLKYGGEGGIDSLRSPLLGPSLGLAPAGPTQALFKNAPGVFVGAARSQAGSLSNWLRQLSNPGRGFSSPRRVPHAKKKPVHAYELFLKYGGEGGLTRFARRYSAHPWASPLRGQRRRCSKTLPAFLSGQPARRLAVCPTGVASCRTPVGGSHPPRWVPHAKKKARTCVRALLKIWR